MKKILLSLGFLLNLYSVSGASEINAPEELSRNPQDQVKVYPLKAGPRINVFKDTDGNQVLRVWGHVGAQEEGVKKVMGVFLLEEAENPEVPLKRYYFPLREEHSWCGVLDLFGLTSGHSYNYLVGYTTFSSRKSLENKFLDFKEAGRFKNGGGDQPILYPSNALDKSFSFFLGSCHFPFCKTQLPLDIFSKIIERYFPFKNPFKNVEPTSFISNEEKDATYRVLYQRGTHLQKKEKNPSALLLVGDQIYADPENVFLASNSQEEFQKTYEEAFGSPDVIKVMGRYPTKTILDDHELQNDFSRETLEENPEKATIALTSYLQFQAMSTSLYNPYLNDPTTYIMDQKLWHQDEMCGEPLFCMDNRTERAAGKRMISKTQMADFFKFLKTSPKERIKFVMASVPFFPDYKEGDNNRADKWSGFEKQRLKILKLIRDNHIQKVVFLGGDVHCSLSAQLHLSTDPGFLVTSVISSPLYWPFTFDRSEDFNFDQPVASLEEGVFTIGQHSPVIFTNNFTVIQVNDQRDALKVQVVVSDPDHPKGKVASSIRYRLLLKN